MNHSSNRPGAVWQPVRRARSPLLFSVTVLTACASSGTGTAVLPAPGRTSVSVTRSTGRNIVVDLLPDVIAHESVLDATPDQVWGVLPAVFEMLQIEVTTVDAGARLMGNRGFRARRIEGNRLSAYVDCGRDFTGPYADHYAVTLSVLVQLKETWDFKTSVTTVVDGSARPRDVSGARLPCQSKATLERSVTELIDLFLMSDRSAFAKRERE